MARAIHGTEVSGSLKALAEYHWPGNIRELENTIERAVVSAESGEILPADLPDTIQKQALEVCQLPENIEDLKKINSRQPSLEDVFLKCCFWNFPRGFHISKKNPQFELGNQGCFQRQVFHKKEKNR
jgi:transcriptional regulator with AAA-type ATPase domain